MSLLKAIANVVVRHGIAVLTQLVVFPQFGLPARIGETMTRKGIFVRLALIPTAAKGLAVPL